MIITPDRVGVIEKLAGIKIEGKVVEVEEKKKSMCLPAEGNKIEEEENTDAKEEEKKIGKSEDGKEQSEVEGSLMFEGKPVIFASTNIREKKKALAEAQAEAEAEAQSEAGEQKSSEEPVEDIKVLDENGN